MSKIFPLARSKRVDSLNQVYSLHEKNNLIVQEKHDGISCHVIFRGGKVSIRNRIGFNITDIFKKRAFFNSLSAVCTKYSSLHMLCIISKEDIIAYDCLKINDTMIADIPVSSRIEKLEALDIFDKNFFHIESYTHKEISSLIDNDVCEIILKTKESTYPIKNIREREPIADWYTLKIKRKNLRDVILDSFYTGSSKNDIVFRCKQYSKGKIIQVGKLRIGNKQIEENIIKAVEHGKKSVCCVRIREYDNKKFKKLEFVCRTRDKPFTSVVVDKERELMSVEVINVQTKKINSFKV